MKGSCRMGILTLLGKRHFGNVSSSWEVYFISLIASDFMGKTHFWKVTLNQFVYQKTLLCWGRRRHKANFRKLFAFEVYYVLAPSHEVKGFCQGNLRYFLQIQAHFFVYNNTQDDLVATTLRMIFYIIKKVIVRDGELLTMIVGPIGYRPIPGIFLLLLLLLLLGQ